MIQSASVKEIKTQKCYQAKYMTVDVHIAKQGYPRQVFVPREIANDLPNFLNNVFKYGQNDIQEDDDCHSVSVGDIIVIKGDKDWPSTYHMVDNTGFRSVTKDFFRKVRSAINPYTFEVNREKVEALYKEELDLSI